MPSENPAGNIAAQAALADDVDGLGAIQLMKPLPQIVHGNIDEALDVTGAVFTRCPRVQQRDAAVARQAVRVGQMPLTKETARDDRDAL